jgi:hypothetical protein
MSSEACLRALCTDATQVVITVEETNTDARRCYSRAGFCETGMSVEKSDATFLFLSLV